MPHNAFSKRQANPKYRVNFRHFSYFRYSAMESELKVKIQNTQIILTVYRAESNLTRFQVKVSTTLLSLRFGSESTVHGLGPLRRTRNGLQDWTGLNAFRLKRRRRYGLRSGPVPAPLNYANSSGTKEICLQCGRPSWRPS